MLITTRRMQSLVNGLKKTRACCLAICLLRKQRRYSLTLSKSGMINACQRGFIKESNVATHKELHTNGHLKVLDLQILGKLHYTSISRTISNYSHKRVVPFWISTYPFLASYTSQLNMHSLSFETFGTGTK